MSGSEKTESPELVGGPEKRVTSRGTEAWETMPGDSEHAVDYPEAPRLEAPLLAAKSDPELYIDLTIYLPDGGRMGFTEAAPMDPDDYSFEDVEAMLEAMLVAVRARVGS